MDQPAPDLAALKTKQNAAWTSGDYAAIGTTLQIVGETLCEAVDLRAGERVLDVAAGNGNASLAAARRFGVVTSTDYVPDLLVRGEARAKAEALPITFQVADAEALPFPDASFDVVLSTFGVMFTPDQPRAAAEMRRVCRPGGRIGLANWTPDSFVGNLFKLIGAYAPPPPGVSSPALWGTEARLQQLFAGAALTTSVRDFKFRFSSAQHLVDVFRNFYGPVHKAFAALEPDRQASLEQGMLDLLARFDIGGGRGLVVASQYLEAVVQL